MIENFRIEPLEESHFVRPALVRYTQEGVEKCWEVIRAHDSVAILIYHKTKDAFILVKQFRPAVYLQNGDGHTYELCAGIVDKESSLLQIAKEEIEEECGYDVPLESIEKVTAFYTSVGFAGSKQTLYFAEVDETMKRGDGGGIEMEQIEVIELPLSEARRFMFDETIVKTPGLLFAFMWFFDRFSR
ncbi:NUDIX domain-containing protein [Hydrogenimonas cancrithermarum]|uniref:NUDIX domain-containing protein n=1 Tax=Hydrogenimonas cancrithermarum TaxID=2993563 RepID=A0ABM8FK19_9BACT|nr:NUDIX domain-containing protein [Hydrogenimonas cancrithermarum]BDY12659.1 NUDIX domain-containing protein [Hydrogenimonas cancrithermarum]